MKLVEDAFYWKDSFLGDIRNMVIDAKENDIYNYYRCLADNGIHFKEIEEKLMGYKDMTIMDVCRLCVALGKAPVLSLVDVDLARETERIYQMTDKE
jgi:hypothetical protein